MTHDTINYSYLYILITNQLFQTTVCHCTPSLCDCNDRWVQCKPLNVCLLQLQFWRICPRQASHLSSVIHAGHQQTLWPHSRCSCCSPQRPSVSICSQLESKVLRWKLVQLQLRRFDFLSTLLNETINLPIAISTFSCLGTLSTQPGRWE